MKRRSGIGFIEIIIIVGILVIIGALIFVALKPKTKTVNTSQSPSPVIKTAEDVKSARKELDQQDVNATDQELNQLSASLNNL